MKRNSPSYKDSKSIHIHKLHVSTQTLAWDYFNAVVQYIWGRNTDLTEAVPSGVDKMSKSNAVPMNRVKFSSPESAEKLQYVYLKNYHPNAQIQNLRR